MRPKNVVITTYKFLHNNWSNTVAVKTQRCYTKLGCVTVLVHLDQNIHLADRFIYVTVKLVHQNPVVDGHFEHRSLVTILS